MRRILLRPLSVFAAVMLLVSTAFAGKFNSADFPLRVHIVARNGIRHYYHMGGTTSSSLDAVDGLGQGNVFENGQPLGFDFNYECGQPITPQTAYDTFMARWRKPSRELEIIMPVMGGRPGEMNSCVLKVNMKAETVYIRRNGDISEEPAAEFKAWMVKHEYDPEHGKDAPVNLTAAKPTSGEGPSQ
jgi:hypothetical protein